MAKPLSMDLRERVLACIGGGVSGRQAAERFALLIVRFSGEYATALLNVRKLGVLRVLVVTGVRRDPPGRQPADHAAGVP